MHFDWVHRTGALKVGDRILAINNESMFEKTLPSAVRILQSVGDQVTLKISKGVIRRSESRSYAFGHLLAYILKLFQ